MPIFQQEFAPLSPGQLNPYHQAFQSGLNSYNDIVKSAYARPTAQANILSKAAYAAYAPASYAAKVLGDQTAVAMMMQTPEGQSQLKNLIGIVGGMPSSPYAALEGNDNSQGSSWFSGLKNVAKNIFKDTGHDTEQPTTQTQTQTETKSPSSSQDVNKNDNAPTATPVAGSNAYAYDKNGNNIVASPEEVQAAADREPKVSPAPASTTSDLPKASIAKIFPGSQAGLDVAQQTAFRAEQGKNNANIVKNLNENVANAVTKQKTYDELGKILDSDAIQDIRKYPISGHYELDYYKIKGTPEQKRMIGKLYALEGNIIKDSSRDFAGQFRQGEQTLLEGMKPAPGDSLEVQQGKLEALVSLNKFYTNRSRYIAGFMSSGTTNFGEAQDLADARMGTLDYLKSLKKEMKAFEPKSSSKTPSTGPKTPSTGPKILRWNQEAQRFE